MRNACYYTDSLFGYECLCRLEGSCHEKEPVVSSQCLKRIKMKSLWKFFPKYVCDQEWGQSRTVGLGLQEGLLFCHILWDNVSWKLISRVWLMGMFRFSKIGWYLEVDGRGDAELPIWKESSRKSPLSRRAQSFLHCFNWLKETHPHYGSYV